MYADAKLRAPRDRADDAAAAAVAWDVWAGKPEKPGLKPSPKPSPAPPTPSGRLRGKGEGPSTKPACCRACRLSNVKGAGLG